jgi:hypothetical protein
MKILKIAKRLNGDRRTGFGIFIGYGLSQIKIQGALGDGLISYTSLRKILSRCYTKDAHK